MISRAMKPLGTVGRGGCLAHLGSTALLALLLAGFQHPLFPQSVQGRVVDGQDQTPVEGALVFLVGAGGAVDDQQLTNAAGRFLLNARGQGTFTVRAERIGFTTVSSDPFRLAVGQRMDLVLETGQEAIRLEGITVQGEQKCILRPSDGLELSRVWGEARKALTVQDWTEREGAYWFQVENYSRELDPEARRVLEETRKVSSGVSRNPIASLPAEELMTGGFIREDPDGALQYYGPDASTLLSDSFLDTHCFELEKNEDEPDLVGLAFKPARSGDLRDIRGTLWLDRRSSALQFLEFRYTWAPHPSARGVGRGRVEFEELPNGSWIVRRWWIRMPRLARGRPRSSPWERPGLEVAAIRETGGEIVGLSNLDLRSTSRAVRGTVSGVVWDSTRSAPLEGARVLLSGTSFDATTDSEGRFLIGGVPEGLFRVTFTHPRLDSLATAPGGVDVEVSPGEVSEIGLGVPSVESILAGACLGQTRSDGSAVISGSVLDHDTGLPISQASVELAWQAVSGSGGHLRGDEILMEVTTDGEGRFTVCTAPAEALIDIQAKFGGRESRVERLRVRRDSYNVMDIEVLAASETPDPEDSGHSPSEIGARAIRGRILDSAAGAPVGLAWVSLVDADGEPTVFTITDTQGRFLLAAPEPGEYWLRVESQFHEDYSHGPISLTGSDTLSLSFGLEPLPVELGELVVEVERRSPRLAMEGVYDRMEAGIGVHFDQEKIEARRGRPVSELIALLPMVELWPDTMAGGVRVLFRKREFERLLTGDGHRPVPCFPQVFLDGGLLAPGGHVPAGLDQISLNDLEAVEVYDSPAFLPGRFVGQNARCGTIVLWTRQAGGNSKGELSPPTSGPVPP